MRRARDRSESGFAMLVVFLLAAFIAIGLYMEMPRVVFESQRNREQTLIDRGEQYRRAIQLYYRRYSRYPPDLKALENTDNRRFLRQRYRDPMTDKDEWRLVHAIGPGVFPDSLVYKTPGQKDKTEETDTTASAETPTSPWLQRRPSDVTLPSSDSMTGAPAEPGMDTPTDTIVTPVDQQASEAQQQASQQPGQMPTVIPGFIPGQPGSPTTPGAGGISGMITPQGLPPGFVMPSGQQAVQPGMGAPGSPTVPGMPVVVPGLVGGQTSGMPPSSTPPAPGQMPGGANNPAARMIFDMLTRPNPRGMQGIATSPSAQQQPTTPMLAGVASNLEADSIKTYNDRSKYNEWEFLYDPRTDRLAVARGQTGQGQGSTQQMPGIGNPGANPSMGPGGINSPTDPGVMRPMPGMPTTRPGRGR